MPGGQALLYLGPELVPAPGFKPVGIQVGPLQPIAFLFNDRVPLVDWIVLGKKPHRIKKPVIP